ncbi:hypothetical protein IMSAG025_02195 [Muribaculaceae bacterium]|nr:hypothetical protein IMSAG025_02195 [Muribaculaceae bacterium]
MTVGDIEQLKGHGSSTLHCVGISAGRAEAAMAAERNKFELSTEGTAIHSPTKGRVTLEFPLIRIFIISGTNTARRIGLAVFTVQAKPCTI